MIVTQCTDRRFIGLPVTGEVVRGAVVVVGEVEIRLQFVIHLSGGKVVAGNPNYILHLEN